MDWLIAFSVEYQRTGFLWLLPFWGMLGWYNGMLSTSRSELVFRCTIAILVILFLHVVTDGLSRG